MYRYNDKISLMLIILERRVIFNLTLLSCGRRQIGTDAKLAKNIVICGVFIAKVLLADAHKLDYIDVIFKRYI